MRIKGILLSILAGLSFIAMAQNNPYAPVPGLRASYMGSLIYPGFTVGVEKPFKITEVKKLRSKGLKTIYTEQYWGAGLAMYHQPYFHTNYMLQASWMHIVQKTSGLYFETGLGLGLSRTFINSATYKVNDDGNVEKVPVPGNFYGVLNLGRGIGYNFSMKQNKPLKAFVKFDGMIFFPYQKFLYLRPAIELGAVYNIQGWDNNLKKNFKTKKRKGLFYKTVSDKND